MTQCVSMRVAGFHWFVDFCDINRLDTVTMRQMCVCRRFHWLVQCGDINRLDAVTIIDIYNREF